MFEDLFSGNSWMRSAKGVEVKGLMWSPHEISRYKYTSRAVLTVEIERGEHNELAQISSWLI